VTLPASPEYTDAVVITDDHTHPELKTHPPAGDTPVELADGLTIERIPAELAERFIEACEPPGEEWDPRRQFAQLYSFVRRGSIDESRHFIFDPDELIQTALQLSRLLVPNGHSTEYAVHMLDHAAFPFRKGPVIVPLAAHARSYAFHPGLSLRDWLTTEDAIELGVLLHRFLEVRGSLPGRVREAMWWCGWTARTPFIQPAHANTVSALEAFLSTDVTNLRAQFVVWSLALAGELDVSEVDAELLDRVYTYRSRVTHGEFVKMDRGGTEVRDLHRVQAVLRAGIRRGIEDSDFAASFERPESIRARWPVPPKWRGSLGLA